MKSGKTGVWFWMVIDEYKKRAGCGSSLRMIERKVVHVKRVVKWGKRIMKGGGKGWDTRLGEVVCLLHDVGRFPQSLYGTFNDGKSINHAKVGRKMFMDSELNDEWTKAERKIIAEAIGEHNNIYYRDKNKYAKLVRDADQLAIIEETEEQTNLEGREVSNSGKIRKSMKSRYELGELIDALTVKTMGERILMFRSWKRRMNFEISKILYNRYKFDEKLDQRYFELFPERKGYWQAVTSGNQRLKTNLRARVRKRTDTRGKTTLA